MQIIRSQVANVCYHAAEVLQIPLYYFCNPLIGRIKTVLTPGKFGNYDNKTVEIIRRIGLILFSPIVVGGVIVCSPLYLICYRLGDIALGTIPYLRLNGSYRGKKNHHFATFNMSTLLPTMTLTDGVEYSHARLSQIANKIQDFHFVCGQEVDGASARFFSRMLHADFSEFYTYLGKSNVPYLPSGLFFAAKEPVKNVTVIPYQGNVQRSIRRLLTIFELEAYSVAVTHLDGGLGAPVHIEEIHQIASHLRTISKPVILCGDFNEDRYQNTPAQQALKEHFIDYIGESSNVVITCTDALEKERYGNETPPSKLSIDYILRRKSDTIELAFTGTEYDFNMSDHHLVKGSIQRI